MFGRKKEKQIEFRVSGNHYHQDDLMKLAIPNRRKPRQEGFDRVFHYYFDPQTVRFSEDPSDPAHPDAIKVFVDDQWIGVVPADVSQEVRRIFREDGVEGISCEITGGPCTLYANGKVANEEDRMIAVTVRIDYVG